MKFATTAAVGLLGATLIAAPLASAEAHGFCGPFFPVCVAGAIVGAAATVATLPLAVAGAAVAPGYYAPRPYYAPPAYYGAPGPVYYGAPAPAYYPAAPVYYAPRAYYGAPVYGGPVAYAYGPHPRFWGRPYRHVYPY